VFQAGGSSEALKLCAAHQGELRLLLTDLLLPPPGFQLAAEVHRYPRTHGQELIHHVVALKPQIRVLLMSAYTDDEFREQGISKEGLPFLQKPFTPEALLNRVRDTLAGPRIALPTRKTEQDGTDVQWVD
jgi:CheY-like chemotaxis protein